MVRIVYTQSSKNSHLIEDLLEMSRAGKQGCVDGVIKMITDLHKNGADCRYLKGLGGGLLELKTRTPTGGARVYLFQGGEGEYVLCHAECKRETEANINLLEHTAQLFVQHKEQVKKVRVDNEKLEKPAQEKKHKR